MNKKYYPFTYLYKKTFFIKRIFILCLIFVLYFNLLAPLISNAQDKKIFAKNNYSRVSIDEDNNIYMRENLHKQIYPASLTKIAISILAIEKSKLKDKVLIEKLDYTIPEDYVLTPLYIGETVTVEDLLYATMLKSGNDAAIYLAKHIFGNKEVFIKGINKYLKEIGLKNTNFTNSFGLDDKNHYTTPYDLLILSKYAMNNDTFRKIVSKDKYTIPANNFSEKRTLKTTSLFADKNSSVFNKAFYGIKSGYTESAGDCFITATKINNKEFYFIYTGANSRISKFINIQEMYDQTIYILNEKENIDKYVKSVHETQNSKQLSLDYLSSKYLFSTFDKIIISTFILIIFLILLKRSFKNKKVKKKKK